MRIRSKTNSCLNCGYTLSSIYNFCPNCGQENNDNRKSLRLLLHDFFSNYFSFDSKISRSFNPFLFKPGFLTNQYNEGKRVAYVHPLRLYLIISLIFFFILSSQIVSQLQEYNLTSMRSRKLKQFESPEKGKEAKVAVDSTLTTLSTRIKEKDSVLGSEIETQLDTLRENNKKKNKISTSTPDFDKILNLMANPGLTDKEILDSLNLKTKNEETISLTLMHQARKVVQKDLDVFIPYVINNIPILMFILIPVYAFFLMIFFRKKPNLYINHLIHALHIHSFVYAMFSMVLLFNLLLGNEQLTSVLLWAIFLINTIYTLASYKRVYKQGYRKTLVKFSLLGFMYMFTLMIATTIEIGISFLIF